MSLTVSLDCIACGADQSVECDIEAGTCIYITPCTHCGAEVTPEQDERYAADAEAWAEEGRAYMRGGYAR